MESSVQQLEGALQREGIIPLTPGFLGTVAQCDPRLANAIIRPDLIGWGEPACGWGWQIINLRGQFTAQAANQDIPFQIDQGIVNSDLWVRKVDYTVQRPNAFSGNIFKSQADFYNRLNPCIDFRMTVSSYCKYVIAPDETPLENIEQVFEAVSPVGFVLGCSTNISGNFTNVRSLEADENPTNVIITLHTVRLPTAYEQCGVTEAVAQLQKKGFLLNNYDREASGGPPREVSTDP